MMAGWKIAYYERNRFSSSKFRPIAALRTPMFNYAFHKRGFPYFLTLLGVWAFLETGLSQALAQRISAPVSGANETRIAAAQSDFPSTSTAPDLIKGIILGRYQLPPDLNKIPPELKMAIQDGILDAGDLIHALPKQPTPTPGPSPTQTSGPSPTQTLRAHANLRAHTFAHPFSNLPPQPPSLHLREPAPPRRPEPPGRLPAEPLSLHSLSSPPPPPPRPHHRRFLQLRPSRLPSPHRLRSRLRSHRPFRGPLSLPLRNRPQRLLNQRQVCRPRSLYLQRPQPRPALQP